MKPVTKAHLAVIATNVLFGVNYAAVKFITPAYILPFGLNIVRVFSALSLFWLLYLLKPTKAGILKKDIPRFLFCAITGVVINQLFFIKGLSLTGQVLSFDNCQLVEGCNLYPNRFGRFLYWT